MIDRKVFKDLNCVKTIYAATVYLYSTICELVLVKEIVSIKTWKEFLNDSSVSPLKLFCSGIRVSWGEAVARDNDGHQRMADAFKLVLRVGDGKY